MNDAPLRVLFLCTGNSCRSILAEALLNHLGGEGFEAHSAGSRPAGFVHPLALACLENNGVPVSNPQSKSWDAFIELPLDLVVTVCDNAAGESCPLFPGDPVTTHWGLPDPATAQGSVEEVAAVFQSVFDSLREHITAFVAACREAGRPDSRSLRALLERIGTPTVPAS